MHELKSAGPVVQQNLGRVLGVMDYDTFPACLPDALRCLIECVGVTVGRFSCMFLFFEREIQSSAVKFSVEVRRNCYAAIPQILLTVLPRLPQRECPKHVSVFPDIRQVYLPKHSVHYWMPCFTV